MTSTVASETIAELVPSFVRGQWWMPRQSAVAGDATTVRDASTGEVLFHVSAEGLDLASVVDYGRTVGHAPVTPSSCCMAGPIWRPVASTLRSPPGRDRIARASQRPRSW